MEKASKFEDFDNEAIYKVGKEKALKQATRNFAVEFGKDGAHIAFDIYADDVKALMKEPAPAERPVRWMSVASLLSRAHANLWIATFGRLRTRQTLSNS